MHTRMVVGGVALSLLLAIGVALSGVLAPAGGTALGASTTLTIIGGDVLVSRDGGPFMSAVDGEVLEPGDAIRTGDEARAVLTYFEGSTVTIEPWSELSIDEASSEPDGSTVVLMTQNLGRTWHVVTKLITGGSRYEVRTPAATASVRGTAFEVGVAQTETGEIVTDVVTAEGIVAAAAPATQADPAPQPVLVQAGFQTTARSTERAPEAPVRAPDPVRTVSVSVGSENTLVVDPLGRANGVKDGKVILQTPGASVTQVNGKILVTMPNLPDGKIATVVNKRSSGGNSGSSDSAPVEVVTTVAERGKAANTVSESVVPTNEPATTGVEVQQSGPGPEATPALRPMREEETKQLPTPKTAVEPAPAVSLPVIGEALRAVGAVNAGSTERASGGNSEQAAPAEQRRSERRSEEQGSSTQGFFPAIPLGALPGAQSELAERERRRAEEERKRFEDDARRATEQAKKAADEAAKRAEEDAQRAAEAARKAAEEAAKRVQEEEQAARKIAEEAAKRAEEEAKRVAEAARKAAEEAEKRAQEQARLAAEQAKKAAEEAKKSAEEAAKRAEEQAKIAAEQARKAAEDAAKRAEQEAKRAADEAKKEAEQALKRAETAAAREINAAKDRLKDAEKKLQSALRGIDVSAIAAARSEHTAATKALADAEAALARIKDALSRL